MDLNWIAGEAKQIHAIFTGSFYSVVLGLMVYGVLSGYARMSLGQTPEFLTLVGRALIASLLLIAFPEVMNTLADITDAVAKDIGQLNNFKLVLARLGEKIETLTWSWVSVKDSVLLIVSYLTFFLLYVSVYMADTLFIFTWTLLYIFSPVLIAAFVLPSTAEATAGLFRSLIEVSCWKVTWSVLAALLWSFALSEINKPEYDIDFLTAILMNILLAFSVLSTPVIVGKLLRGGLHHQAAALGGVVLGAAALTPTGALGQTLSRAKRAGGAVRSSLRSNDKSDEIVKGPSEPTSSKARNIRPQKKT